MDTSSLLQEYLLLDRISVVQHIHLGASFANELKYNSHFLEQFQAQSSKHPQSQSQGYAGLTYATFRSQRLAAAQKMKEVMIANRKKDPHSFSNSDCLDSNDRRLARQAEQFDLKSRSVREVGEHLTHASLLTAGQELHSTLLDFAVAKKEVEVGILIGRSILSSFAVFNPLKLSS